MPVGGYNLKAPKVILNANREDMMWSWLGRKGETIRQPAGLSLNTDLIIAVVTKRATKVVNRAGRMALGSAVQRAPVRQIFKGGRRVRPRFYTLAEAKLALPSFLRTEPRHPSSAPQVQAGRMHPLVSTLTGGHGSIMTRAEALDQLMHTRIQKTRNKANNWQRTGQRSHTAPDQPAMREVSHHINTDEYRLTDTYYERALNPRGKYELKNRAGPFGLPRALSMGPAVTGKASHQYERDRDTSQVNRRMSKPVAVGELGGTLRRSIEPVHRNSPRGPKVSIVAGGADAPYARFVEFGTRHAAAQPFLRPALKHVEGPYKAMMRAAFPGAK